VKEVCFDVGLMDAVVVLRHVTTPAIFIQGSVSSPCHRKWIAVQCGGRASHTGESIQHSSCDIGLDDVRAASSVPISSSSVLIPSSSVLTPSWPADSNHWTLVTLLPLKLISKMTESEQKDEASFSIPDVYLDVVWRAIRVRYPATTFALISMHPTLRALSEFPMPGGLLRSNVEGGRYTIETITAASHMIVLKRTDILCDRQ
jgi:hypothetical protein